MIRVDILSALEDMNSKLCGIDPQQPIYASTVLDSFEILQLITQIEVQYEISLDINELLGSKFTISDLCRVISVELQRC